MRDSATNSHLNRETILNVAWELFLKNGYKNTSLQMIIEQTGGSLTTIYKFFKNKKVLFLEAMHENGQIFIDSLEKEFIEIVSKNSDLEHLEQYFYNVGLLLLREMLSEKNIAFSRLVVVESYDNPEIFDLFRIITVERTKHFLSRGLNLYNERQNLGIKYPQKSMEVFTSLIVGPYLIYAISQKDYQMPSDDEIKHAVNRATKIFMLYLKHYKEIE